jgi:hypothetical protein
VTSIPQSKCKLLFGVACFGLSLALSACGGGGNSMVTQLPITVSLPTPTVVVTQGGPPLIVQIIINSTSETALVAVIGLPGGVQEQYAASNTNPSGTLTFTAAKTAPPGTYTPTVNVNSAGQMASRSFTLIVKAATGP